ncbi:MAG TPA: FAD-dependent oxidoreductase [Solirubrobacteraceae bacterium]|nr:FAD-dependent oxidoreductase [Solirubrobacteraceae bacterium]
MARYEAEAAVVGGGVVGCAVAHALAARGVETVLLEARPQLGTAASGTNSGIVHTGFDSPPGELETELILRAGSLRGALLEALGVPVRRCGALLRAEGAEQREAIARLARNAAGNGVETEPRGADCLLVPGESITDPAAFTSALGALAARAGASVRTAEPVAALAAAPGGGIAVRLAGGGSLRVRGVANCAGLYADELAAVGGDAPFEVYPRKGEFLVFAQPSEPLKRILLPVPSAAGKGVLVFPTVDGHVIAGPTARDRTDKEDWSVEPDAGELILAKARAMWPALEDAEPLAAYAGLRPAGRGVNYAIAASEALPGLVDVAAVRSTGLTAAPAIGERVARLLAAAAGLQLGPAAPPAALPERQAGEPWWRLAAAQSAGSRAAR